MDVINSLLLIKAIYKLCSFTLNFSDIFIVAEKYEEALSDFSMINFMQSLHQ